MATLATSRPIRVLHVLTDPQGGGGAYAEMLSVAARDRGWSVCLAVPASFSTVLPTVPLTAFSRGWTAAARRADIVHCHGIRSALLQPVLRAHRTIVTPHGLHAFRRTEGVRHSLVRVLTRRALRRATAVICVSSDELETVSGLDASLPERSRLILNGVAAVELPREEHRLIARRELGLGPDDRVIAFVGGLRFQKHPELAVEAVRIARERDRRLVLVVAGDGPLRPVVERSTGEWIRMLGERDDVHRILVASDAVLNTSRWEGLSLALLEGLWRGRPLIATDAPGNADAVGEAGFVVGQRASDVADAILRLFDTPGLRADLSRRARSRAELLFDQRVMVEKTLAVYEELVDAPS